ncbi:hypothetical protein [Glutamicibacter sp.]|uniref:hypothetical protein n=1 Tax=Glutamicibacter sp. TaxID=1931995 RepID=UPI0028BD501C|nr:hypothetical protein [Glutamicibacter sp.]
MKYHSTLQINDVDYPIFLLLYAREIKGIATQIQLPPLSPAPGPEHFLPAADEHLHALSATWMDLWFHAWAASSSESLAVPGTNQRIEPADEEFEEGTPIQWLWTARSPEEAINMASFEKWYDQVLSRRQVVDWRAQGDRMNEALDAGLDTIYALPLEGYFQYKVNQRCLVISAQVLRRPDWLSKALQQWLAAK